MKIGILSLNPGHNYGGILQSYALQTMLERMGHEVKVLCRKPKLPPSFLFRNIPRYCVRFLRNIFRMSDVPVFAEYQYNKRHNALFYCSKLNLRDFDTFDDIQPSDFDAFVVGSDQVWRPMYFEHQFASNIENAYLSFALSWNVKRVAYAPSFGVEEWEYSLEQSQRCGMFLAHFDALSVREESGIALCREHLGRNDAVLLCDPTMLLKREDYESLVTSATPPSRGNLFVYCLDDSEELNTLVTRISKEKALIPFDTMPKTTPDATYEERQMPTVESWLRAFMDAELVITDSFHACVFSLIFKKPFLVIGNASRGMSRFETLLATFGQEARLLRRADDYDVKRVYPSFDNVDAVFERLRKQSLQFLNNALK